MSLVGILAAVAAAKGMGFLEAGAARRAIGLLIGVMALVIRNFLPKLRPLNSPHANPAKGMAAERSAGWILVLAGTAYIALFLFAQLDQAGRLSSVIGISALVAIAANWGAGWGEPPYFEVDRSWRGQPSLPNELKGGLW